MFHFNLTHTLIGDPLPKLFYSAKVVCAYLETTDPKVLKLAKKELQPLLKEGVLKLPERYQPKKSG